MTNEMFQRAQTVGKADTWDRYSISVIRNIFQQRGESAEYPMNDASLRLLAINAVLWDLEDDIRKAHLEQDKEKICLYSRMIIEMNRRRAALKARITEMEGEPGENKTYAGGL